MPNDTGFEDPFTGMKKGEGNVTIGSEKFTFKYLENIAYKHTAATLIDVSDNIYLFHNHNNVLSFYDNRTKEKRVIDEHINQAKITPDGEYIIYTKNAIDREAFYYVDTEIGQRKEFHIFAHDKRMEISNLAYRDGVVYFSFKEEGSDKSTIKMATLPSYTDSFTKAERDAVISNESNKLFQSKKGAYFYNQNNNSLDIPLLNGTSTSLIEIRGNDIKELLTFDYVNKNKWALGITNEHDESVILTPS